MHLYFYLGLRHVLYGWAPWLFVPWALFMITAPVLSRICESTGLGFCQRPLAMYGYYWMGFIFLTISSMTLFHLISITWKGLAFFIGNIPSFSFSSRNIFILSAILSVLLCIYGYQEARDLRTVHLVIGTSVLPEEKERIRIVQISDLHLGVMNGRKRLVPVVDLIVRQNPDIIVSTGDLVDGQMGDMDGISGLLFDLSAPLGKYAVPGNHEFYTGIDHALEFSRKCGFKIIRNAVLIPADLLSVGGVDDPAGNIIEDSVTLPEEKVLEKMPADSFRLLLKHQPVVDSSSDGRFELQLSGHTHGGQIFPFSLFTRLAYCIAPGISETDKGSIIYVSRGTGTWGPPFRVMAPPEITVIDLVRTEGDAKVSLLEGPVTILSANLKERK